MAGWVAGRVALEEWKLRLTSAKVQVEVEAELGNYRCNLDELRCKLNDLRCNLDATRCNLDAT